MDGHPPIILPGHITEGVERLKGNLERARNTRSPFAQAAGLGSPLPLSDASLALANRIKKAKETKGENWIEAGNQRAYVQILRVALIYAVADGASQIEPVHLEAAEAFVDYAATGIVALGSGELQDVIAQRILAHLQEEGPVTRTGISSEIFSRNVGGEKIETAIRVLKKLGRIEEVKVPTKGRPATVIRMRTS